MCNVLPPMIKEDEVYIQPKEKDPDSVLVDFLDDDQFDGFNIYMNELGVEALDDES